MAGSPGRSRRRSFVPDGIPGRGFIDNSVSTDVGSVMGRGLTLVVRSTTTSRVRATVRAITLRVSHVSIAVVDAILNDPPAWRSC